MSIDITPIAFEGRHMIQSYGDGKFQISEKQYYQSLLVFPDQIIPWVHNDANDLTIHDFEEVLDVKPVVEVLLLGCGEKTCFVAHELREQLKERGTALELMDTGAACRTFNVLLGEDRRVAAALMLVD